jgi:nicotinamide-nucleotide amidase
MEKLVKQIFEILKEKGATLGTAESCTGGLLASDITSVSGSSEFFVGSIVSYANSVKEKFFGVTKEDLKNHGAVSQVVAEKMGVEVRHQLNCTYGIGITGIAGPGGGSKEKPVGTVWLAVCGPDFVYTERKLFSGDRQQIRKSAAECALKLLLEKINQR